MLTIAQTEAILCAYPAIRERYQRSAWPWPAGRGEPGVNVQSNTISDPTAQAVLRSVDGEAVREMAEYQRAFAGMSLHELAAVECRCWRNLTWQQAAEAMGVTTWRARAAYMRGARRFARLWRYRGREREEAMLEVAATAER